MLKSRKLVPERLSVTLRCRELGCRRGSLTLFRNVEFQIGAGEVLQVVGGNGSGKSTLLRTLVGLRPPDAGTVLWRDSDVHCEPARFHSELLFIGHASGVKENLNAVENVIQSELLVGPNAEVRALEALAHAGLSAHAYSLTRTLSQGQRRRVALARLYLAQRKQVWILDEPFVGLDSHAVKTLCDGMQAHRASGGIIVYTTHQDSMSWGGRKLQLGKSV